jgi:fucose permease
VAATIAASFGFQAVGVELTLLCVVMVVCIFLTVDRAYHARMAERRGVVAAPAH